MPKKLEEIRRGVLTSLRDKYPNKSDKEIEEMSWGIATKLYKKLKLKD